jgi:hypothetical protein
VTDFRSLLGRDLRPIQSEELTPRDGEAYADMHSRLSVGRLYHYTSQAGFLGILRDKAVRATDIRYLNDAREYEHAIAVAVDIIEDELRGDIIAKQKLADALGSAYSPRLATVPTAFIFSLTELRHQGRCQYTPHPRYAS